MKAEISIYFTLEKSKRMVFSWFYKQNRRIKRTAYLLRIDKLLNSLDMILAIQKHNATRGIINDIQVKQYGVIEAHIYHLPSKLQFLVQQTFQMGILENQILCVATHTNVRIDHLNSITNKGSTNTSNKTNLSTKANIHYCTEQKGEEVTQVCLIA